MINTKEVMIGNYVAIGNNDWAVITEIHDNGLQVDYNGNSDYATIHYFDAIPLTDEWFKKLGFNTSKCRITNANVTSKITENGDISYFNDYQGLVIIDDTQYNAKYVHELQNLVKVITGENLRLIESPYNE